MITPTATWPKREGLAPQEADMASTTVEWQTVPPQVYRGGAVAIGNFDGVHQGHAALLVELRRQAAAVNGPAVALTLDPHPLQLLRPHSFLPPLSIPEDRVRWL